MSTTVGRASAIALAMLLASVLAVLATPKIRATEAGQKLIIEERLPKNFGAWKLDPIQPTVVTDPRLAEMLDNTYSQTVSRTYENADGRRIMLSIAYGEDQSRRSQLHKPETCYPAQGFALQFVTPVMVATRLGEIKATRLYAVQNNRHEPITYWMRVGNGIVRSGLAQAIERVKMGLLHGEIPDGLLFRVSTLSSDPQGSFQLQDSFIRELLEAADPEFRQMLIGRLSGPA